MTMQTLFELFLEGKVTSAEMTVEQRRAVHLLVLRRALGQEDEESQQMAA